VQSAFKELLSYIDRAYILHQSRIHPIISRNHEVKFLEYKKVKEHSHKRHRQKPRFEWNVLWHKTRTVEIIEAEYGDVGTEFHTSIEAAVKNGQEN
jgi:hypothetical protein